MTKIRVVLMLTGVPGMSVAACGGEDDAGKGGREKGTADARKLMRNESLGAVEQARVETVETARFSLT
ncbi:MULTISPECIES: hypothetical protein [Streptomyces]